MVREDLVTSAVSFLQDPSVASAPIEKRISFLQSKNLTQDEIDAALARAGSAPAASAPAPQGYAYQQPPSPAPPPGYGAYPGYWQQPPPEVPKRDWRDWFIMATVMGGVGYGLYFTAKRYILPLIAPPTPPQIEQDKNSIDESFNRAFALLEQLEADTKALKASEEARTSNLDTALSEMETATESLRESLRRRDADSRRLEDDVRGLRELIPRALEAHKESTDNRLKDLSQELKSLKTLVANRMGGASSPNTAGVNMFSAQGTAAVNGAGSSTPGTATPVQPAAGSGASDGQDAGPSPAPTASRPISASPYGRFTSGRAAIPAWQMAAAKKNQEPSDKKEGSESGPASEAGAGA